MANEKTMRLIKQAQDAVSDVIRNEVENRSQNGVTYNADDLSAFVAHELTYNRAKPLEKVQAPLEAFEIFTVSNDIPEGAESAVQKIYSKVGMAKIISDYADDIPCVDVYAEETTVRVKTIATSYRYSIQEILNSAFANIRLTEEKARTAYHYIDTKINDIAWHGDSNYGITGFLDNTYVTVYNVKADGTSSSKKLADKTPIQMFRDVNELIDSVANNTNGYIISIQGRPDDKIKLFKLKRKKEIIEKWYNSKKRFEKNEYNPIVKIEKLNYSEEMTCFYVDNEEHLFLTENFIVTHNTRHAIGDACQIAYPLRFNTENWQWESTGNSEKTLFIATEQELDEIQTLVLAYLTGFNEEDFLYDNFNFEQRKIVEQAVRVMETYSENLFIVRLSNPNIEQIKAVVRQNWILHNIQNVFYDYIFSSPSLLNEFRDLKIREDVALNLLSTALKDLAVELKIFVMSATQTNAKSDEDKAIKNEAVIRGARSIIDKCDIACVISRVTKEDEEILAIPIQRCGIKPNQVTDVYKVRRGKYTNVRIWSYVDLGTCRKTDLFVTNERLQEIDDFQYLRFEFGEEEELTKFIESLNDEVEKPIITMQPTLDDDEDREANSLEKVDEEEKKAKGLFGDLL